MSAPKITAFNHNPHAPGAFARKGVEAMSPSLPCRVSAELQMQDRTRRRPHIAKAGDDPDERATSPATALPGSCA